MTARCASLTVSGLFALVLLGLPAFAQALGHCLEIDFCLARPGDAEQKERALGAFERGTPIDRYYLHAFLAQQQHLITGDVLEVQTDAYTQRFGSGVHRADTFDIVPSPDVTYVCDFSHCERSIPNRAYDCLLLPNTLPHFRELEPALSNAIRVVRPGGAILASAAGLLPLTGDVPEYWRLSPDGWRERLSAAWPGATLEISGRETASPPSPRSSGWHSRSSRRRSSTLTTPGIRC
jgi:SAM-dependent methyltransferase